MAGSSHHDDSWLDKLARFGYFVKGVVYLLVGILAVQAAFAAGRGGDVEGPRGAIASIAEGGFGQVLLWLLALGLFGYALWKFIQAAKDTEHEGSDAKGTAKRIGFVVSGLVYASLGVWTIRLVTTVGGGGGGGDQKTEATAWLLSQPFGAWLVGAVGLIIIGVGLYQLKKAVDASFMKHLAVHDERTGWTPLDKMTDHPKPWVRRLGRAGHAARAVTYAIIGGFVIVAAIQSDPDETRGLGGALETLGEQPYGPWLLGLVALGLACYGVYCMAAARYRVINADA
jgi:hypothetical protein